MKILRQSAIVIGRGLVSNCAVFLVLTICAMAQTALGKAVGTVKSVSATSIVLTTDSGEVTVTLADSTRILRALPGQTDLKSATPIQASDIHVGDRVLAIGPSEGNLLAASTVVVMTQSDISGRHQQEREEWRRGVGGIVKEVNPAAGTVAIVNALVSSGKPIVIHMSPATSIRRYSPDSVSFDQARPGTLDQVKTGDQIYAQGTKNEDGSEFTAQAIVSGTFRNIEGTVVSTDATNHSLTVMDLITKHPVTLKITTDSQMHKLPPVAAQRLAAKLKAAAAAAGGNSRGENGTGAASAAPQSGEGYSRGGPPDFQQILSRMPSVAIADLQKGDAVMVVATEGSAASAPTAITLISGVEPILTAAPGGAAAAGILSPWNLGASPGGEGSSE